MVIVVGDRERGGNAAIFQAFQSQTDGACSLWLPTTKKLGTVRIVEPEIQHDCSFLKFVEISGWTKHAEPMWVKRSARLSLINEAPQNESSAAQKKKNVLARRPVPRTSGTFYPSRKQRPGRTLGPNFLTAPTGQRREIGRACGPRRISMVRTVCFGPGGSKECQQWNKVVGSSARTRRVPIP